MTDEAPKRPRGRPVGSGKYKPGALVPETEYNPNMLTEMYELMRNGAFDCEIYSKWGIRKETFYYWKRTYPEFQEVHERGLGACEAWWITQMRERFLGGDDKGFKYCISIMNNKFNWSAKDGRNSDMTVNINNVNVLPVKNTQQMLDYIQSQLDLNSDIIDTNDYKLIESNKQD